MFTGIVEEVGIMESLSEAAGGWSLTVKAQTVLETPAVLQPPGLESSGTNNATNGKSARGLFW